LLECDACSECSPRIEREDVTPIELGYVIVKRKVLLDPAEQQVTSAPRSRTQGYTRSRGMMEVVPTPTRTHPPLLPSLPKLDSSQTLKQLHVLHHAYVSVMPVMFIP
jgi:hypothetical protein